MLRRFSINGRSLSADVTPRYEKFWALFAQERWEPATFEVFEQHLEPGAHYVDVGAWIGPTLLYAAHIAGQCTAFEPDPVAYCALEANIRHNPELAERCTLRHAALTTRDGTIKLTPPHGAGKSETSCLLPSSDNTFEAEALNASRVFPAEMADAAFIKMDIEGGEYDTIPAMTGFLRSAKPVVLLSLHPNHLSQAGRDPVSESSRLLESFSGYGSVYSVGRDALGPAPEIRDSLDGMPLTVAPQGTLLFLP
ncbi:FkbM family methyltransferase [Salidesulfovibrio brasiliensis]|uniref:FkbM family methyltransferase n=1 Tax=Salidesulfovibrio brasiliensis TaxID=221711 RepID=UPI0006D1FD1B|nr:FkbM family methyltransferase [Salidesulfovibrio brasiliensis]